MSLTTVQGGMSSALVAGTAVATTSGTSIDFTSIPSWVKRITVIFNGVSTNSTSQPLIQIGSGSVQTTGYTAGSRQGDTTQSGYTTGFGMNSSSASNFIYGHMVLTILSGNSWVASHSIFFNQAGVSFALTGGGVVSLSGTLDRLRLTTVNGTDTFDAGSINILYE